MTQIRPHFRTDEGFLTGKNAFVCVSNASLFSYGRASYKYCVWRDDRLEMRKKFVTSETRRNFRDSFRVIERLGFVVVLMRGGG